MIINTQKKYRLNKGAQALIGTIEPLMFESLLVICEVDTESEAVLVEADNDPTLSAWVYASDLVSDSGTKGTMSALKSAIDQYRLLSAHDQQALLNALKQRKEDQYI